MTRHPGRGGDSTVLAVDVGGTSMKGAVVGGDGTTLAEAVTPTPAGGGQGAVHALRGALLDLRERAAALGHTAGSAGVVTPGIVDERTGTVCYASNLGWREVPLQRLIEQDLGVPVAVGHDVRAAGLAESLLGVAGGADHFVQVPIGTGIAAALISDGRMITGIGGAAGELGHIPVHPGGEQCRCGQRGCLEVYASAAGIARRYRARTGAVPGRAPARQPDPAAGAVVDAARVVGLLGADGFADAVWRDAVEALALGLATVTLLLDPELIVIGGGLSRAGAALADPLRARLGEHLSWRAVPRLALSALGPTAGRTGAAVLAMRAAGRDADLTGWTPSTTSGAPASRARTAQPVPPAPAPPDPAPPAPAPPAPLIAAEPGAPASPQR